MPNGQHITGCMLTSSGFRGVYSINSSKTTGNFPALLNFNRLFLKPNRFIYNKLLVLPDRCIWLFRSCHATLGPIVVAPWLHEGSYLIGEVQFISNSLVLITSLDVIYCKFVRSLHYLQDKNSDQDGRSSVVLGQRCSLPT